MFFPSSSRNCGLLLALHSCFGGRRRCANLAEAHGNFLQRLVFSVEKPCAEVSGPSAVDNRGAHDVRSLVESEPLGNAIINDGLAIAINTEDRKSTRLNSLPQ